MAWRKNLHTIVTYFIAAIWFINGFFCKVLNLVPRHKQIVARILGSRHSFILTKVIGTFEILLSIWVLTGIKIKFRAVVQIIIVAIMNSIEFFLAPDLLLWGKLNSIFAVIFILLIYYNEFILNKEPGALT